MFRHKNGGVQKYTNGRSGGQSVIVKVVKSYRHHENVRREQVLGGKFNLFVHSYRDLEHFQSHFKHTLNVCFRSSRAGLSETGDVSFYHRS